MRTCASTQQLRTPEPSRDRQVELAEALGVSEQVDFGDLPVGDREAEDDPRLPAGFTTRVIASQVVPDVSGYRMRSFRPSIAAFCVQNAASVSG